MNDKELVARHAAEQVRDGMLIGLGTGSTANCFIDELARRCREEGLKITTASSSVVSAIKARELGLPLTSLEVMTRLDLYVDGADEVDSDRVLLKGQGSDLVREKIMARASDKFLVMVDQSKRVNRIGERFAIPVEVMPFAWQLVKKSLEKLGGQGELRKTASGLAISSYGSLILDMAFDPEISIEMLNHSLNNTPGVVEHGIFFGLASAVYMAVEGQVQESVAT